MQVEGDKDSICNLSQENKLNIVIQILDRLKKQLQIENVEYRGSKTFKPYMVRDIFNDKILNIVNDGSSSQEYGIAQSETTNPDLHLNLSKKDWFVFNDNYGTSEEKHFVKFIDKNVDRLKERYSEVYLIRNERHFQIFSFDNGHAFEPDFVLVLIEDNTKPALRYQLFIEPKGSHLIQHDEWKQSFLMQLKSEHKIEQLWKDREYVMWGMPFYNEEETKAEFQETFDTLL